MSGEPVDLFPRPQYTWRVTTEGGGILLIEAVNARGVSEQEVFCTVAQAHALAGILAALDGD